MTRALVLIVAAACTPRPAAPVPTAEAVIVPPKHAHTCALLEPKEGRSWTDDVLGKLPPAEPYVARIEPGSRTMLLPDTIRPVASYLNAVHNRVHPIFADGLFGALEQRPKDDPLNDDALVTRVELVLDADGAIETMGVIEKSGQPIFDAAALESLRCAEPFGPAPPALLSAGKKVYLHWEFDRYEVFACSTMHAKPYLRAHSPGQLEKR